MYVTKGRRLMVFANGGAIAMATNHTLTITPSILEDRTKDDGDAPVGEFDTYTWSITTDSIVGLSGNTNEHTIVDLIDGMLQMESVTVACDAALPASGVVPNTGWSPSNKASDYPATSGEAWIESISITAGSTGYANASITFKGQGKLS